MSIPISTIETAIQEFCTNAAGVSGSKVIFAYQGGTEPSGSYVSIIPALAITKKNSIDESAIQTNGDVTIVRRRVLVAQIDAYGPDALELISNIYDGIDVPEYYGVFETACLAVTIDSGIRNLSFIKNIRYEQRYNLDLRVQSVYTDNLLADDVGWFNTIRMDTTTLNPQLGEITITRS